MSFKNLGLCPEILAAVKKQGYEKATPIQEKSIPKILEGRDVLAGAQTGTGKTAAFSLPIIQMVNKIEGKKRGPYALILTPTRELAAQILECLEKYSQNTLVRSTVIFGGVKIGPQTARLKKGVDILVATPGRLLDHVGQKNLNLSEVETLVLDEADRMLDMGFIHDIKKVLKLIPEKRQNLLFSATYSKEIKQLADKILNNPEQIEVAPQNTTAEKVNQVLHPVSRSKKRELLSKLINEGKWEQTLVFTRTKHGANRLIKQLMKDGITAAAIHGNKSQSARTKALAQFKSREIRVLVATDIAARGIDINLLPHVVNFEIPQIPESYVHRIGRTGRAGANGKAVSLVCPEDHKELAGIEKLLGKKIPVEKIPGFDAIAEPQKKDNNRSGNLDKNKKNTKAEKPSSHKQKKNKNSFKKNKKEASSTVKVRTKKVRPSGKSI